MTQELIDRLTAAFLGHADHVDRDLFGRARDRIVELEAACVPAMPDDVAALVERLEDVAAAYPDDMFPPFSADELKERSVLISQASGCMGRFLAKHMIAAASAIKAQAAEIQALAMDALAAQGQAWDNHARAEAAEAKLREAVEVMRDIAVYPGPHADESAHWRADAARTFLSAIGESTNEQG